MAGGEAAAGSPSWGTSREERRHLTVIFSDLVGSTDLASSMDPEDWHEVLAAYHQRVAEVVADYGGIVSQFQGDGMVAFFGYPHALGSAGREAVAAALALVAAVEALTSELPAELSVPVLQARVGINSGEVVVSPIDAGGVNRFADIFGEVPNLAARLQGVGEPGDVLLSDATARLVSGYFVTEPLGALELKGIPRPVPTFRVLGHSTARSRLDTGPLTVFVPRPSEMAWLRAQWDSTARGPARLVLVVGEAGIGKSRLLAEFIASRAEDGETIALYCAHRDALSPLRPFESAMGALPLAPDVAAQWLEAQAERGPTLVLVEDAHWADPSTLEAIEQVARSARPILVVLTARPEIESSMLATVSRRLNLDRLSPDESLAMVLRVPGAEGLPVAVQQGLRDRADGVPLFLEELTRGVLDEAASGDHGAGIPLTLTEVITARLDRLGEAKRVAQMAAIVGRAFDPEVLADASGFERDQLDLLIQRLIDQAVVEPSEERDGRFWFRHALIHEAAYASVLRSERKVAHAKVADVLIGHGVEVGQPEVVAFHLGAAGRPAEAVEMWHQAARAARHNSRFKEAASHERELLSLVPQLPREHQETTELGARSRLTLCLTAVDQGSPEIMVEGTRVQELARRADDHRALLRSFMVLLPWWQANAEYGSIDQALPEAVDLAQELGDEWAQQTLRQFEGAARIWQGRPAEGLARLEESFHAAGFPLDTSLLDAAQDSPPVATIVLASTRIAAALGYWLTGRLSEAARLRDDTRRFAAARGVPQARAVTAATASIFAQLDGDRALVAELAAEALGADETTTRQWQQWAAVFGWWLGSAPEDPEIPGPFLRPYFLTLRADRPDAAPGPARVLLAEALSLARASGERFSEAETLRVTGRLAAQTGDSAAARIALGEAVATARAQGMPILELRALTDLVELADPSPQSRERLEACLDQVTGGLESHSVQRARAVLDAPT